MALDNEFIGNKIREIREFHNMTQSKFAERLHMTQQTLSRYENGKTTIPYEALANIAVEFKVPVNYFLGIDTDNISSKELLLIEYYRKIDGNIQDRVFMLVKELCEWVSDK